MNHELVGNILGFILAHSASIGDALDQDELMVPYVIEVKENTRTSSEFEAESQQEAVEKAQLKMASLISEGLTWSYSQDGLITLENGKKQDVFFFKVWVKGMVQPLEAYQMYFKTPFKLIGNVQILNYEESGLLTQNQDEFINGLDTGINSHPAGSEKWDAWYE